jgi:hypothetical protein
LVYSATLKIKAYIPPKILWIPTRCDVPEDINLYNYFYYSAVGTTLPYAAKHRIKLWLWKPTGRRNKGSSAGRCKDKSWSRSRQNGLIRKVSNGGDDDDTVSIQNIPLWILG